MLRGRPVLFAAAAAVACLVGAGAARADVIDGNWCAADGRTMMIDGPRIVTPRGTETRGEYSRHHFAYEVPAGEADAGTRIEMQLLDETTVRVAQGGATEIWRRCDLSA